MNKCCIEEQWKDIKGYEGIYLISNRGRVLSLYRYKERARGTSGYFINTRELKKSITTTGYESVGLVKDGKTKTHKIHRLVAKHFVANPFNRDVVNHIDGDYLNNNADNLEWCTTAENCLHALDEGLKRSFDIDKNSLEYLYLTKNMTPGEIGRLFGLSRAPIDAKLEEYAIEKRPATTYRIKEEWLEEQFKCGLTNKEIAESLGCDQSLISKYKSRIEKGEGIYAK